MPRIAFTDLGLRSLKAQKGQRLDVWDAKQPGFGVRVSPNGTKTFVLMYWHAGRKHRMTLGRFPGKSLSDARADALAAQSKIEKGKSPVPPAPTIAPNDARFPTVVDRFVEKYCAVHNRTSTAYETERILRTRFVSAWRDRDVRSITRADVIAVLDTIITAKTPSAANHALAAVRKLFSWCVERSLVETNPCSGIRRPAPTRERDRALHDDELVAVWSASLKYGGAFGSVVQLLILTAQRRGEVAGMRWSELDLEKCSWTIPADRTKNKRVHVLPLSPHVCSLLKAMPRTTEAVSEFVFPARGNPDEPMSGFSKLSPKLAATIDVENWTLHDLRRTAATGMARLGVAPHVVERVLNHTSGTFAGVAGIYNRFSYSDEMRAALTLWETHVLKLVSASSLTSG